ncbi:hypothetical protein SAMN04487997_0084 [Frateuria terrea]|uniref:Uncharacterized protein n=1 Tax=Frateuria terrea TaxID=529704 RepID=A0A1H6ZI44_9GAMM|nr:hypothetical protein SAMN04487997_0084 [Frateuria terrea]SFP79672.1 hypothetical protein SAMN02927913_0084 [Frateuria terrea]
MSGSAVQVSLPQADDSAALRIPATVAALPPHAVRTSRSSLRGGHSPFPLEDSRLAKINYAFEKRQRELAKKKQQDAKQALKRPAREGAKPAPERSEPSQG